MRANAELCVISLAIRPHARRRSSIQPGTLSASCRRPSRTATPSARCSSPIRIRTTPAANSLATTFQAWSSSLELVDVPVYVHKTETHILQERIPTSSKVPTENNQVIELGGDVQITLVHTPGHTPGSQCFLVQQQLISGDTLFIGACGRVDLPNSSPEGNVRQPDQQADASG